MTKYGKAGKVSLVLVVVIVVVVAVAAVASIILLAPMLTAPTLERVEVEPSSAVVIVGESRGFVAKAFNTADNEVQAEFTWSLSPTAKGSLNVTSGPMVQVTAVEAGSATLKASATLGGVTKEGSASLTINLPPAKATSLQLTGIPSEPVLGTKYDVAITVRDQYGEVFPTYTGTIRFNSTDAKAKLPAEYTFTGQDAGRKTFAGGISFGTHGLQTVSVVDKAQASVAGSFEALVLAPPTATFSFSVDGDNRTVYVNASATRDPDGSIISYDWDWDDGSQGSGILTSHVYDDDGSYNVTLTVTDDKGLEANRTRAVVVQRGNLPPVTEFSYEIVGLKVTVDASGSFDPVGFIESYAWDWGDGNTSEGVAVSHDYAIGGTYTITLNVTDDDGAFDRVSETISLTSLDVTFFDFFDTPFGDYWLSREIWGDSIYSNTFPYVHKYESPLFLSGEYELNTGAKMIATGRNLPEVTIDGPLFFPLLGDLTIPGGQVDLSYRLTYPDKARLADLDCVYFRCRKTLGNSDDGWITEWRGNLTMDRTTAAKVIGLPETANVADWWTVNELPLEDAWFFHLDDEGNFRLDIFNGFEWPYDNFVVDLNLFELPDGRINLEVVDIISWGNDVLFNRWMYWGHVQPVYTQGEPDGFFRFGEYWYDNAYFNFTIRPDSMDADIFAWVWYALVALDIPGVGPTWEWSPFLMDYLYNTSAHPYSELKPYFTTTEEKWSPCSADYGTATNAYTAPPHEWELRAGETLTFQLPTAEVMVYKHTGTGCTEPEAISGTLTFGQSSPDLSGNYDSATKTLRIVGPFDPTMETLPLSQSWPTIEFVLEQAAGSPSSVSKNPDSMAVEASDPPKQMDGRAPLLQGEEVRSGSAHMLLGVSGLPQNTPPQAVGVSLLHSVTSLILIPLVSAPFSRHRYLRIGGPSPLA